MTYDKLISFRDNEKTGIAKGYEIEFLRDFYSKEELEKELMDVLITTLVLANELEIDVEKQLTKKLDIIFDRFNLN